MKFITLFTLLLIAFVGYTSAQSCMGMSRNPRCIGARDVGSRGQGCFPRTMWYYDARTRQCQTMNYLGCDGNDNRHCDLESCRRRCV